MEVFGVLVDQIPEDCKDCNLFKQCDGIKFSLSKGKKCPLVLSPKVVQQERVVEFTFKEVAGAISFLLAGDTYVDFHE